MEFLTDIDDNELSELQLQRPLKTVLQYLQRPRINGASLAYLVSRIDKWSELLKLLKQHPNIVILRLLLAHPLLEANFNTVTSDSAEESLSTIFLLHALQGTPGYFEGRTLILKHPLFRLATGKLLTKTARSFTHLNLFEELVEHSQLVTCYSEFLPLMIEELNSTSKVSFDELVMYTSGDIEGIRTLFLLRSPVLPMVTKRKLLCLLDKSTELTRLGRERFENLLAEEEELTDLLDSVEVRRPRLPMKLQLALLIIVLAVAYEQLHSN